MAYDVFLSYGREDVLTMQQVEKALRKAGFAIWTDRGIAPGSPSWKAAIEQAILDARCIVVLFSPDSAESRWVRAELDYADAQHKPIYPLLVRGDAANAVPFGFTTYQWIDIRDPAHLSSGLAQLTAALKGTNTAPVESAAHAVTSPTSLPPSRKPFRGLLPLIAILVIVGVASGVLFLTNNRQTAAPATATLQAAEADTMRIVPTALPMMPPFVLPDGYKKVEGEKTIIAVPTNWSTEFEQSFITESLMEITGQNADRGIVAGTDILGVDLLSAYGTVVSLENLGFPISYKLLKDRQQEMFEIYDPNGIFTSADLVEMPAGTMLYSRGDGSDGTTFLNDYVLMRGTLVYHILLTGRLVDREKLEQIGEQIAHSFRIKE